MATGARGIAYHRMMLSKPHSAMPRPPAPSMRSRFSACRFLLILTFMVSAAPAFEQKPLSRTEETLIAAVRASEDDSMSLLERAVNINSGTMNFQGVRQVADLFRPQ